MKRTLVVAGATGSVGRALIKLARAEGWHTRAVGRDAARLAQCGADETRESSFKDTTALAACIEPGDVVFSALGASASPSPFMGWRGYYAIDTRLNLKLLEAAVSKGAAKFQYVAMAYGRALRRYQFSDAHERVVDAVIASGLPYTILRPTGIFSTFRRLWGFARLGLFPIPGSLDARSNPVHERDIAAATLAAIPGGNAELELGGPDVLTRREMGDILMRAAGRENGRCVRSPAWFHLSAAALLGVISPRVWHMLRFYLAISEFDNIAPKVGTLRLCDYYAERQPGVFGGMHRAEW
jgi:uncharacterized protein YbjT (DUF2867 family)